MSVNLIRKDGFKMEEIYTVQQVVYKFKVSKMTVFRWIKAGKLKAKKIGRSYYIKESSLDEFMGD